MEASIAALSRYQISRFFSTNAPLTQEYCNQEAERITGVPARPTRLQEGSSYTVVAGESVVQFRVGSFALDLELLGCVEQAYAGFVPHHRLAGKKDDLHIYTMNNVGGVTMYLARDQLYRDNYRLLRNTLEDYARFFASAWHNTPGNIPSPDRGMLLARYSSQLTQLSQGLPPRFRQTLDHLIQRLPGLFAQDWPMVPNHPHLLENNIYVDPDTGRLVGIFDWRYVEVSPFGMSLGGLETMLGITTVQGIWCYHKDQRALRDLFWETLSKAMRNGSDERLEVARLVGLFLANGFQYDEEGNKIPVCEGIHELTYLDAVVLGHCRNSTSS